MTLVFVAWVLNFLHLTNSPVVDDEGWRGEARERRAAGSMAAGSLPARAARLRGTRRHRDPARRCPAAPVQQNK